MDDLWPLPLTEKENFMKAKEASNGDLIARNDLIAHNMRLISTVLKGFKFPSSLRDDLESVGKIALMVAVDSYIVSEKLSPSTYYYTSIKNAIMNFFRKYNRGLNVISLDEPADISNSNSAPLIDFVTDNKVKFEKEFENKDFIDYIYRVLDTIDEGSVEILSMLRGLSGYKQHIQEELAGQYGVCRSNVAMLERKILSEIKKAICTNSSLINEHNKNILLHFYNLTFEEFINLYGKQYYKFPMDLQRDIRCFYNCFDDIKDMDCTLAQIEQALKIRYFPWIATSNMIICDQVQETDNIKDFSAYERMIIACFLFRKIDIEFIMNYFNVDKDSIENTWQTIKKELKKLYHNIVIDDKQIDKDIVIQILDNPVYCITDEQKLLLQLFYGIGYSQEYSIEQIVQQLNLSYIYVEHTLMKVKNKIKFIYYDFLNKDENKKSNDVCCYCELSLTHKYEIACFIYGKKTILSNRSEKDIISILKDQSIPLTFEERLKIAEIYHLNSRDIMNGYIKRKVLKRLFSIYSVDVTKDHSSALESTETSKRIAFEL